MVPTSRHFRPQSNSEPHLICTFLKTPCSRQAHRGNTLMPGTKKRCGASPWPTPRGSSTHKTLPHPLPPQPHFSVPGNGQEAFRAQLPSSLRFGITEMTGWRAWKLRRGGHSALVPDVWGRAASREHSLQVLSCLPFLPAGCPAVALPSLGSTALRSRALSTVAA